MSVCHLKKPLCLAWSLCAFLLGLAEKSSEAQTVEPTNNSSALPFIDQIKNSILKSCADAQPMTGQIPDTTCTAMVQDLLNILQPHERRAISQTLGQNYHVDCSQNHLDKSALQNSSWEITDRYLVKELHQDSLEKALAYLLINLRVDLYRQGASGTLLDLALDAVHSADDLDQKNSPRELRHAFRLLAMLSHNHSLEVDLSSFVDVANVEIASAELPPLQQHYFGRYWRSEVVSNLLRGYKLLRSWYEKRQETTTTVSTATIFPKELLDYSQAHHFWLAGFVGCELRNQGYPAAWITYGLDPLGTTLATMNGVNPSLWQAGLAYGANSCTP